MLIKREMMKKWMGGWPEGCPFGFEQVGVWEEDPERPNVFVPEDVEFPAPGPDIAMAYEGSQINMKIVEGSCPSICEGCVGSSG